MPAELPPDLIGCSGLYNVRDPLLRRLRIEEQNGAQVTDLARTFKDVELLVFYAGSAQGAQNLQQLHKDLTTLMLKEKSVAVIYVSTDVDAKTFAAVTASQPWYRLIFHDDSDFAPLAHGEPEAVEIARGEEFVQAGEVELGAQKVPYGRPEDTDEYERPLSRAAVGISMRAYSTPSLAVYHIPTHQFLARNLRPSAFSSSSISANMREWRRGDAKRPTIVELVYALKVPLFCLLLAMLYHAMVYFGGPEYHFVAKFLGEMSWITHVEKN